MAGCILLTLAEMQLLGTAGYAPRDILKALALSCCQKIHNPPCLQPVCGVSHEQAGVKF